MFAYETDFDPVTPAAGELLTEIGLDPHAVREALADDRARRCPGGVIPAHESWREAGEG